ncbi:DUF6493 family protein [Flavobacterium silvaticum]|uniref:WGR domain-containing protein n=1 Tax=Flavobacterium silvaticum TaxID=1852020 RepID=A0A972JKE4_9FLAO|nr:DUF6493 family protein [Flavobacterium silvaticum]NMH29052.1 WGR domain-containing protein [Flavobacterium silvaticum]
MKKHLTFTDGTSDKFWQIEVVGQEYTVTYGRSGTAGTSQTKSFSSPEECLKAAEKILTEKIKKGYSEDGQPSVTSNPSKKNASDVAQRYDDLVRQKRIDDLLPFLTENAKGNLEILKKAIRKNRKYWTDYVDLKDEPEFRKDKQYNWGQRGDYLQTQIIILSAIAVFGKSDVNSWDEIFGVLERCDSKEVSDILFWAKPNWINDYLLEQKRKNDWRRFKYKKLRFLEDKLFMEYNPELFAWSIAALDWNEDEKNPRAHIEYILSDETAWKRDVKEVFHYDSNIQNYIFWEDRNGKQEESRTWEVIFNELIKQGKLPRAWFIENAILIQTKEWNNNAKSFFRRILLSLDLSPEDFLPFQENIFACLHNPVPAVTAFGIDLVKQIFEQEKFSVKSFLEWVEPMLMRADCKASVKTTLQIFEKLLKSQPKYKKTIHVLIADVFMIPDLNLQQRVAKILAKSASAKETELVDKLTSYSELIQGSVRAELSGLLGESHFIAPDPEPSESYIQTDRKEKVLTDAVTLPQNWNDILFLFGEFIASEDVLTTEMLLNTYIVSRHLFPNDQSEQLKPYLKQLESRYLEGYHRNYSSVFLQQKMHSLDYQFTIQDDKYDRINTLLLIKPFLHAVQSRMNKNVAIPMLSFPSHKPHWVEPKILLERLLACQENNIAVDWIDLAIAISRMPRENVEEAAPLLDSVNGELKDLMRYCLGLSNEIKMIVPKKNLFDKLLSKLVKDDTDTMQSIWAVAARTHDPDGEFAEFRNTAVGSYPLVVSPFDPEIRLIEKWNDYKDWNTGKMMRSPSWYVLGFQIPKEKPAPDALLYSLDLVNDKNYYTFISSDANVVYWNSLMPQNPDALALNLLRLSCDITEGAGNDIKAFLQLMDTPGFTITAHSQKVLACAFFKDSKEIRMTASEIFGNLIEKQRIDIGILGKFCAFLANNKYAPFQRLSDSVAGIKDISRLHNSALHQFYDSLLGHLEFKDKLPVNFKKIVENYLDVSFKTGKKPDTATAAFFDKYKDTASLKPLIKQILN